MRVPFNVETVTMSLTEREGCVKCRALGYSRRENRCWAGSSVVERWPYKPVVAGSSPVPPTHASGVWVQSRKVE